jgi:hypothetical protein
METSSNNYSRYLPYAAAGITAGIATYLAFRWLRASAPFIAPEVKQNLPVAKKLKTIPDVEGNYDIDGVSFDSEGVVVSSDVINPS